MLLEVAKPKLELLHQWLPIALQPSAFDAKPLLRDRGGVSLESTKMPFFREAMRMGEEDRQNLLATNNYRSGKYDKFEDVCGETLKEDYLVRNSGCVTCPIRCARVVKVEGKEVKGPEVETLGLFGPNILNNNMQSILDLNYEMDELGIDTISCGNTISFAMELNEKGMWKN